MPNIVAHTTNYINLKVPLVFLVVYYTPGASNITLDPVDKKHFQQQW